MQAWSVSLCPPGLVQSSLGTQIGVLAPLITSCVASHTWVASPSSPSSNVH